MQPLQTEAGHCHTDAIRLVPANLNMLLENSFHTKPLENGESFSKLTFKLQSPSQALEMRTWDTCIHVMLLKCTKGVCWTPSHNSCVVSPLKQSMLNFVPIISVLVAFMFTGSNEVFYLFHCYSSSVNALIRFPEVLLYPLYP